MSGELSLRVRGGDDNRVQCEGKTTNRCRGPAMLTCITNSLCDLQFTIEQMGAREGISSQKAFLCGQPWPGGDRTPCQWDCHDTWEMCRPEDIVGKWRRATVQHCKTRCSTIHVQMRTQQTPPAKAATADNSGGQGHTIRETGDILAGGRQRSPPDVQWAAQRMHPGRQVRRSQSPNPYKDVRGCSREFQGWLSGIGPSGRTIL